MPPPTPHGRPRGLILIWSFPVLVLLLFLALGAAAMVTGASTLAAILVLLGLGSVPFTVPRLRQPPAGAPRDTVTVEVGAHPRLADTLTRAARAAGAPTPQAVLLDQGFGVEVPDATHPDTLIVGHPLFVLLGADEFEAMVAYALARPAPDPVSTALEANAAAQGAIGRLQARLYASTLSAGQRTADAEARATATRLTSAAALDHGLTVADQAATSVHVSPYVDLFDNARSRAPLAEAVRQIVAARTPLQLPGTPASSLFSDGEDSLVALEERFFAPDFPLTDWPRVAGLAAPSASWDNLAEAIRLDESPSPRSVLTRDELADEWDLRAAAHVALSTTASRPDWGAVSNFYLDWDDPAGLDSAIAAAHKQGDAAPVVAFLEAAGGDLDATPVHHLDSLYLGTASDLDVSGTRADWVRADVHVFGDGLLVLPVDPDQDSLARARSVARRPQEASRALPGAQWYAAAEIAGVMHIEGMEITLGDGSIIQAGDTGSTSSYPAEHTLDRALAGMLLAGGVPWTRVWNDLL